MKKSSGGQAEKAKGKFQRFAFKRPDKKPAEKAQPEVPPPVASPPKTTQAVEVAYTCAGELSAGSSLAEMSQSPQKREASRFAGQRCQAPKEDGICGAYLSRHNPNPIPVCQPCARRLAVDSLRRGESPDLEKIWSRILARRQAQAKAAGLAARPSGVRDVHQPPEEAGQAAKASVA
jgi:hypothetical protein